jgi:membrane associated rhomboid family serine protease
MASVRRFYTIGMGLVQYRASTSGAHGVHCGYGTLSAMDEHTQRPDEADIPTPSDGKASEWITALSAAGFDYRLSHTDADGWVIHVPADLAEAARNELDAYETVNRDWPPRDREPPAPALADTSWSPAWVCGMLIVFYVWLGPYDAQQAVLRAAAADGNAIRAGEWWRTITALTLHSGIGHLAGNVAALGLLGHAVCRLAGSGVGWAAILSSGIAGNVLAVRVFPHDSVGVGASTACFGALGILCGHRIVELLRAAGPTWTASRRAGLAAGTGLALLGLLGTAPHSDLAAHAAGFFCGALAGAFLAFAVAGRRPRNVVQHILELACITTVMMAWRIVLKTVG